MALLVCTKCTTAYSVGAPRCPHCGNRKSVEQGTAAADALLDGARPEPAEETDDDAEDH